MSYVPLAENFSPDKSRSAPLSTGHHQLPPLAAMRRSFSAGPVPSSSATTHASTAPRPPRPPRLILPSLSTSLNKSPEGPQEAFLNPAEASLGYGEKHRSSSQIISRSYASVLTGMQDGEECSYREGQCGRSFLEECVESELFHEAEELNLSHGPSSSVAGPSPNGPTQVTFQVGPQKAALTGAEEVKG